MVHRLQKVEPTERTEGADIFTWQIGSGEASVWDFGGQLEYTVTHQFLLSYEVQKNTKNSKKRREEILDD